IRNQVVHTTPLLLVAGAMLLPPELLVLVPLISHVPDWIRKKYAWYIQSFNILNFTLAVMCAWVAARIAGDAMSGHPGKWAVSAGAAAATFVVLNNLGFAIVADLDLLRNINNTYGHLAGDAVLAGIADILRKHLRHYDVAARFGGEEFAMVLPETNLREAWRIAERIREAAAGTPIWAESA